MNRSLSRRALLCALCILGVFPVAVMAQAARDNVPVVTLAEARRRAAQVSPAAVAADAQVETAAWERRSALADLLTPRIEAGATYIRFSDPFFNFGTAELSPSATSATVTATYSVLGTGKLAELRRARAALSSATANETVESFRTAWATDAAYYAVLAERELARVAADRLRRAEQQLGVARVRVVAGEAIATDSLQLLLEVNRARLAQLRSDSALTVSRLSLGRQIGLAGPADAAPLDSAMPPPLPVTLDAAITELRTRGPEVQAARAAERRADAAVGVARAGYWPGITVGAVTGAYDSEFFPTALKRGQLQLAVTLPLWNGGARELTFARARAERTVAIAEREERERAAAEAMTRAYHGYTTARAGTELALAGVSVATENYRVHTVRYREGATTILDLLEAQVALSEAEASLVQSRYAARLALAQIEMLLGRRLFTDINP